MGTQVIAKLVEPSASNRQLTIVQRQENTQFLEAAIHSFFPIPDEKHQTGISGPLVGVHDPR